MINSCSGKNASTRFNRRSLVTLKALQAFGLITVHGVTGFILNAKKTAKPMSPAKTNQMDR